MKAIVNGKILLEDQTIENGFVRFTDRILGFGPMSAYEAGEETLIDAKGQFVSPGFIDIHIHGFAGADSMDGEAKALHTIASAVRRNGVTGFLATTMTMPKEAIIKALDTVKAFSAAAGEAKILGVHLEGPFIHPEKKGAQNEAYIQNPTYDWLKPYMDVIRVITLAPDTEGAFDFIDQMKAHPHVKLSIGHTNADFETAEKAKACGVNHITHCFNAMPPLHHRKPSVLGSMLSGGYTAELIADNIHVHKGLYKGLYRVLGHENLVLVTDCMRAGGLEDGIYDLGGQEVKVADHSARLTSDGSLAGSVLKMNEALQNVYQATELSRVEVVRLATLNPARVLGLEAEIGSIVRGKKADLLVMNEAFDVIKTFVDGN